MEELKITQEMRIQFGETDTKRALIIDVKGGFCVDDIMLGAATLLGYLIDNQSVSDEIKNRLALATKYIIEAKKLNDKAELDHSSALN